MRGLAAVIARRCTKAGYLADGEQQMLAIGARADDETKLQSRHLRVLFGSPGRITPKSGIAGGVSAGFRRESLLLAGPLKQAAIRPPESVLASNYVQSGR